MDYADAGTLRIARPLYDFVNTEAIPGTGVDADAFWRGYGELVRDLAPRNRALLDRRDALQDVIDAWHRATRGRSVDSASYFEFLRGIGYLEPEPAAFSIGTENVDPEIAGIAGPQLVVPVTNARYALNAANARWGSLYDALYGTDAVPEEGGAARGDSYNRTRGIRVTTKGHEILNQVAPLAAGGHQDVLLYALAGNRLAVTLKSARQTGLAKPEQFVGYRGDEDGLSAILLKHNGLHIGSRSIAAARSARKTRRALPISCWRRR